MFTCVSLELKVRTGSNLETRYRYIYKTYYTSQREIYLTADECNKCFILIGTPPGSFSH